MTFLIKLLKQDKIHKSKKDYDRKREKKVEVCEVCHGCGMTENLVNPELWGYFKTCECRKVNLDE